MYSLGFQNPMPTYPLGQWGNKSTVNLFENVSVFVDFTYEKVSMLGAEK